MALWAAGGRRAGFCCMPRWRLLTNRVIDDPQTAQAMVGLYRRHWLIEEYFHTLKTGGFDIEAVEIAEPDAMLRFCAAAAIAALIIFQLVKGRENTRSDAAAVFAKDDLPLIRRVCAHLEGKTARQKNPYPKDNTAFAAWVIARLGGWDAYYGKPGQKTMQHGLRAFHQIRLGARLPRIV
jgi:Transposase DDE domain